MLVFLCVMKVLNLETFDSLFPNGSMTKMGNDNLIGPKGESQDALLYPWYDIN